MAFSCSAEGGLMAKTAPCFHASASATIVAPAASYCASKKPDSSPAPFATETEAPFLVIFSTSAGMMATLSQGGLCLK